MSSSHSTRVIYIGGTGRCGSTLVERILNALPGVCALGEVMFVWQRALRRDIRCGCGAPFAECDFWNAVGENAFGGWHQVDLPRVRALQDSVGRIRHIPAQLASPRASELLARVAEYAGYYSRVYRAAAAVAGTDVIVDSSKNPGLAFCLLRAEDLDLRVVHLVRDPRGVAYSWTKQVSAPETNGTTMMMRVPPAVTALQWNADHALFRLLARAGRRRNGDRRGETPVRQLCYEELLSDPRRSVRSLAEFAGLEVGPADLSYLGDAHADLGPSHSAAGNPMRFTTGRVPLRHDNEWRSRLPGRHRRTITMVCSPILTVHGYPVRAARRQANTAGGGHHQE